MVTICNSTPEGTLTIDMVKDSLLNEDARRKEQGNLLLVHLLLKNKKDVEEVIAEIHMVIEEDPSLEEISNVFTVIGQVI